MACYLAKDVDEIIYTRVANQHPDSDRFLHDCEKLLGRKITIIQSEEYKDVDDVIERTRCINTPYGAPCTERLKKTGPHAVGAGASGSPYLCVGI